MYINGFQMSYPVYIVASQLKLHVQQRSVLELCSVY